MIPGQSDRLSARQRFLTPQREPLLQRHPVLVPVTLLSGSVALCIVSFFAPALFPLLAFFAIPSSLLCLSFALVLGICGTLTGIISIIERYDRSRFHTQMFPQAKEGTYK
jgi:VIT1/CCC1 family predicted Fe2+/Mn2+ transporter